MTPEIRSVVSPPRDAPGLQMDKSEAGDEGERMTLHKLCELSELFAQANDPEHYPAAREKWKDAEARMPQIITPDLFKEIEGPVQQIISVCEELAPKGLAPVYFHRQEPSDGMSQVGRALFLANSFVKRCPDYLVQKFASV